MRRVESLAQYKQLTEENKKRFSAVDSNFFSLASSLEPYIADRRLYYRLSDSGLAVFADEGDYYSLYYFWNGDAELDDLRQDKPVILIEPGGRRREAYLRRFEEKLFRAGFAFYKRNSQYELRPDEAARAALRQRYRLCMERAGAAGFRAVTCTDRAMAEQVLALWRENLDVGDFSLEHTRFLSIDTDTVRCFVDGDGRVMGAVWFRVVGATSEERHLVARKEAGGQGIGTAEIAMLVEQMERGCTRFISWVSDSNEKSIHMHTAAGYQTNGKVSVNYILHEKE